MAVQRAAAALGTLAILAGLVVTIAKPAVVHATAPTPGIVTTFAGGSKTGYATSIPQYPNGLAINGTTLYISSTNEFLVRALDLTSGVETIYAGNGQAGGPLGDGGQAVNASLSSPTGLAIDSTGNLYIVTTDRVRKVTPAGVISTVAGGGAGCTLPCSATAAQLTSPAAVSVNASGTLFIADRGAGKIWKVSSGVISLLAGNGGVGFAGDGGSATAATFWGPSGVAANDAGDVWIADTGNNRIREVDHTTGNIDTVAGGGADACSSGPATSLWVSLPAGISLDPAGHLLIGEPWAPCVQSLSGSTLSTVAGLGSGVSGSLAFPVSAVGDASNNLYIADPGGPNPGVFKLTGSTLTRIAGDDGTNCAVYGLGGPASSAMLCRPRDVKFDAAGNMYIADWTAAEILKVDVSGTLTRYAGTGVHGTAGEGGPATSAQLSSLLALAVNAAGDVYLVDGNAVRRIDHASGLISTVAGSVVDYGFSGDGGPATSALMFNPWGIAFDPSNNLYIADVGNYRVRKVTPAGTITTFAGNGGSCSDLGYSGPATGACLNSVTGVASDSSSNIYIAHGGNVDKVDPSGYLTNYGPASSAQAIAVGPQERVVATTGSQAVLFPSSGSAVVLAGVSPSDNGFEGDGGPARSAKFNGLYGVAIDSDSDIFLADMFNRRVRRVQAYATPTAPSGVTASAVNRTANVSWSGPADDGGLPIVRYTVTPYQGLAPGAPVAVNGATSTQIGGLVRGTPYTFAVSASNGWAEGPESAHSSPLTLTVGPRDVIDTATGAPGSGVPTEIGQDVFSLAAYGTDLYMGDIANPVVRKIDNAAHESVVAGNDAFGLAGDGGPALQAAIDGAGAIAVCGGAVYIADTYNFVIRMFYPGGGIQTVAGTGAPGYSGDGGLGTKAQIGRVFGLACRTGGGIYISDSDNGAVRILANNVIDTWWYGLSFPTGIVELSGLNDVVAVSDDGGDNAVWFLTDSEADILAGTPGKAGNTGDGGYAGLSKLNDPQGLAQFGCCGNDFSLLIADRGNNRIREVDSSTGLIHAVAGSGVAGYLDGPAATARFNQPSGVAIGGPSGVQIYVADEGNHRVRVTGFGGADVSTVAGNGTLSLAGDGGPATSAQVGAPYAIAFDAQGNEYIADDADNVIRKVDVNGTITTIAGKGTPGFSGDHGQATSALLNDPRGVAVDAGGNVYISDTGNQRIRKVDVSGVITTVAGTGVAGYAGDNGPATSAKINYPRAVAVDSAGNVYIADSGNHRVRRFTPGGAIVTVAGNGMGGFSGDGVATSVELNLPRGLAIDGAGNLFIGDSGNNRVRKLASGMLTTVAGSGTPGVRGDGGPATSAQLNAPFGVAVDGAGKLYIADTNNHRIRVVDAGGTITTVVGICGAQPGFRGDGKPAGTAQLNFPFGLAADPAGDVYIADSDNNRVRTAFDLVAPSRQPGCSAPPQQHPFRFFGVNPSIATTATLKTADFGARITSYVEATPLSHHIATVAARAAHRLDWRSSTSTTHPAATPAKARPAQNAPAPAAPAPIASARGVINSIAVHVAAPESRPLYALALVPIALIVIAGIAWRRRSRSRSRP